MSHVAPTRAGRDPRGARSELCKLRRSHMSLPLLRPVARSGRHAVALPLASSSYTGPVCRQTRSYAVGKRKYEVVFYPTRSIEFLFSQDGAEEEGFEGWSRGGLTAEEPEVNWGE